MVRVMKSPNIMSTIGRIPVMAAPTATPVNPASEMGVSTTRPAPNSSTNPERTLNGVPASATSSPKMQTWESRRISSASASRTACANVSSRSGIDVLLHFIDAGIRSGNGELHGRFHGRAHLRGNPVEGGSVRVTLIEQPLRQNLDGIAVRLPKLLLLLGTVILAIDVSDVMPAVTIGIALQKCRSGSSTRSFHEPRRNFMNRAHVLAVHSHGLDAESSGTAENAARRGLCVMRVLVVLIVFADVDHRQLPQLRQVHHFVERSLAERTFSEEADCDAIGAQSFGRKSGARGDTHATADNRVGAEVAGCGIGDVHRSTFAAAIAGFFS